MGWMYEKLTVCRTSDFVKSYYYLFCACVLYVLFFYVYKVICTKTLTLNIDLWRRRLALYPFEKNWVVQGFEPGPKRFRRKLSKNWAIQHIKVWTWIPVYPERLPNPCDQYSLWNHFILSWIYYEPYRGYD